MAVLGLALFALSLTAGLGLAMIWLPAVLVGSAWPRSADGGKAPCVPRLRRPKTPSRSEL
jgi:hypothetical protein